MTGIGVARKHARDSMPSTATERSALLVSAVERAVHGLDDPANPPSPDDLAVAAQLASLATLRAACRRDHGIERPLGWFMVGLALDIGTCFPTASFEELVRAGRPHLDAALAEPGWLGTVSGSRGSTQRLALLLDIFPAPWIVALTKARHRLPIDQTGLRSISTTAGRHGIDVAALDAEIREALAAMRTAVVDGGATSADRMLEIFSPLAAVVARLLPDASTSATEQFGGYASLYAPQTGSPTANLILAEARHVCATTIVRVQHGGNYLEGPSEPRELNEVWASDRFIAWGSPDRQSFGLSISVQTAPAPRLFELRDRALKAACSPDVLKIRRRTKSIVWITDYVRLQHPEGFARHATAESYDELRCSLLERLDPVALERLVVRPREQKAKDQVASSVFLDRCRASRVEIDGSLPYVADVYFADLVVVDRDYSTTFLHRIFDDRPVILLADGVPPVQENLEAVIAEASRCGIIAGADAASRVLSSGDIAGWWASPEVRASVRALRNALTGERRGARPTAAWRSILQDDRHPPRPDGPRSHGEGRQLQ